MKREEWARTDLKGKERREGVSARSGSKDKYQEMGKGEVRKLRESM